MAQNINTIVNTTCGKLEGSFEEGLFVFRGIPYAAPPVGERRWLPPVPFKKWDGVRPAKQFEAAPPQNAGGPGFKAFDVLEPLSEDCLFLNIWSPGLDDKRRPVMVWIHGGGFNAGAGSLVSQNGSRLASRGDVVVVTINYRLGALGFLNLNEVTGGKIPATGNEGLLDQILALEWVRDNIAGFGGDTANVTVFGESAGAMSIACMMAMPVASGSFRRAILESGAGNTAVSLENATEASRTFLKFLGVKPDDINTIRAFSPEKLMAAQLEMMLAGRKGSVPATSMAPTIDGKILPRPAIESIRAGSAGKVDAIIGCNAEEWKLFTVMNAKTTKVDEARMIRRLEKLLPPGTAVSVAEAYRNARAKREEDTSPSEILSAIQSDLTFRVPGVQVAEAQSRYNTNTYSYLFSWKSPILGLGACHALEIGFVFGTHDSAFCGTGPSADLLSLNIQDSWTAFARTGNPGSLGVGDWPSYGVKRRTMILDKKCYVVDAPYDEERQAIEVLPIFK
jgi:para-nitrobenzyl esterase